MKKAIVFFIICNIIILKGNAQTISITASNKPLNEILIELRDTYGAEFSFNDSELAKYTVSVNKTFSSIEDALAQLLKNLPFVYEKSGNVYVVWKKISIQHNDDSHIKRKKKIYRLNGTVIEQNNGELLPFSIVAVNGIGIETDAYGTFSYFSNSDSIFVLQISHLGYFIKDTVVNEGRNYTFELIPSVQDLEEVVVTDKLIETFSENGEEAGKIKLNHMISKYLPGSSDNSVFNLLRLQPGIMASAEQSNDLIIWGAYQGQSQVIFDGFTLFGLKNFNDNICAVNPYMVQHIQILKGGFDAGFGGRVGGIVDISGRNGWVKKPSLDLSISNFTVNGLFRLPISKNSSLQIAGRKTYYDLYNAEDVPILRKINDQTNNPDAINNFDPQYKFADLNVKYALRSGSGDLFYISMLSGTDDFSYNFERLNKNWVVYRNTTEKNLQKGASVFYGKTWKNDFNTSVLLAYSGLDTDYSDSVDVYNKLDYKNYYTRNTFTKNTTEEYKLQFKNAVPLNEKHSLQSGLEYIVNQSFLEEDTSDIKYIDQTIRGDHITLFVTDKVTWENTRLKYGVRLNYLPYLNKFYREPRISVSTDITKNFRFNAAWGRYQQFVSKSSVLDDLGNYKYIWTVADNADIPVTESTHVVNGLNFHKGGLNINIEAYYKKTDGLTRYVKKTGRGIDGVYKGKSKSLGTDVFIKQNFKGNSVWVSYSLGKTTELFDYHVIRVYRLAPQNQTHELKAACMIDLDPFYLSANYVYGSGFSIFTGSIIYPVYETGSYSRLDAAAVFKFSGKHIYGEMGLSVLNVLNKENIKFSNFERIPADQTSTINIYNDPIPFTPTLYLKIRI